MLFLSVRKHRRDISMKIPKTLKIGGFIWTVEESEKIANEGNVFGSTHSRKQRIFLEPNESRQKKEHTLIHEIMHALWWQAGLNSRYKKDENKFEEEIVDALSNGLYQVLKDNNFLK